MKESKKGGGRTRAQGLINRKYSEMGPIYHTSVGQELLNLL